MTMKTLQKIHQMNGLSSYQHYHSVARQTCSFHWILQRNHHLLLQNCLRSLVHDHQYRLLPHQQTILQYRCHLLQLFQQTTQNSTQPLSLSYLCSLLRCQTVSSKMTLSFVPCHCHLQATHQFGNSCQIDCFSVLLNHPTSCWSVLLVQQYSHHCSTNQ